MFGSECERPKRVPGPRFLWRPGFSHSRQPGNRIALARNANIHLEGPAVGPAVDHRKRESGSNWSNQAGIRVVRFSLTTGRQTAVLGALCKGKPNKIIAYELGMCESTVKVHVRNIMKKLRAKTRTEIAYLAREWAASLAT
jgi:DNA-binding NarL/FixJ family response regulator